MFVYRPACVRYGRRLPDPATPTKMFAARSIPSPRRQSFNGRSGRLVDILFATIVRELPKRTVDSNVAHATRPYLPSRVQFAIAYGPTNFPFFSKTLGHGFRRPTVGHNGNSVVRRDPGGYLRITRPDDVLVVSADGNDFVAYIYVTDERRRITRISTVGV